MSTDNGLVKVEPAAVESNVQKKPAELAAQARVAWANGDKDAAIRLVRAAIVARAIAGKRPYSKWEDELELYENGPKIETTFIYDPDTFPYYPVLFDKLGLEVPNEMPKDGKEEVVVDYTFNFAAAVTRLAWNVYYAERHTKNSIKEENPVPPYLQELSTLLIRASTERNKKRKKHFQDEARLIPTSTLELIRDAGCNGSRLAVNFISTQRLETIFKVAGTILVPVIAVNYVKKLKQHFSMLNATANRYDWDVMRTLHRVLRERNVTVTLDFPERNNKGVWNLDDPKSYPGRYRMNRYLAGMDRIAQESDKLNVVLPNMFGNIDHLLTAVASQAAVSNAIDDQDLSDLLDETEESHQETTAG